VEPFGENIVGGVVERQWVVFPPSFRSRKGQPVGDQVQLPFEVLGGETASVIHQY
jgi:hypothetical protein